MLPDEVNALFPQTFSALTDTVPAPVPMVIVADVVPCPAVIDHPVPITDQVYDVAPETAEMLNIFPVELAHLTDG